MVSHLFEPFDQRNTSVFILQAIILGTTFLQLSTNTTAYYSRGGILFLSILQSFVLFVLV